VVNPSICKFDIDIEPDDVASKVRPLPPLNSQILPWPRGGPTIAIFDLPFIVTVDPPKDPGET
jgi:hypothetical protein